MSAYTYLMFDLDGNPLDGRSYGEPFRGNFVPWNVVPEMARALFGAEAPAGLCSQQVSERSVRCLDESEETPGRGRVFYSETLWRFSAPSYVRRPDYEGWSYAEPAWVQDVVVVYVSDFRTAAEMVADLDARESLPA